MPFINLDTAPQEFVTPRHSTAFGSLATGESIEVGRLRFTAGEGANRHEHPQEQIILVISGRVRVQLADEVAELGPGAGFHAPPWVPHQLWALEDSEVVSCKSVVDGAGHRIWSQHEGVRNGALARSRRSRDRPAPDRGDRVRR